MRSLFKSDFTWQFVGGFALGAAALITFQPATSTHVLAKRLASVAHLNG